MRQNRLSFYCLIPLSLSFVFTLISAVCAEQGREAFAVAYGLWAFVMFGLTLIVGIAENTRK